MAAESEFVSNASERDLFLAALAKTNPQERAAFLEATGLRDPGLPRRLEELFREHETVGSFLEHPALAAAAPARPPFGPGDTALIDCTTEQTGDQIGRYKLLQKIGEGGCGVVYMAEQSEPVRRRVALKVIKLGMDIKSVIARFEAERQALAMMDHPHIAKVLDGGATASGRPYFVMELVRGVRITDFCDQNSLPTADRLKLFIQVCQAIQHAHQKGIIHRDIKPSNILVTLHDGVPVPKVIDFGIAKATEQRLTDKTFFTEFSAFIGTPAYMSPEQAEMSGLDIDTRSDIYALGVLLYELLTGKTPLDAETLSRAGLDECRRTIREEEPVRPSTRLATMLEAELTTTAHQRRIEAAKLIHLLRGDLDWIVIKCLEKDRTRRYATANDLAAEIQRYLDGEPVLARPPSRVYRLQKFSRRHRGVFAAVAGIAVTLLTGIAISTWQAVRATKAEHNALAAEQLEVELRQVAEQEKSSAHLNEYVADINLAQQSLSAGNLGRAMQLLDKHRAVPGEPDLRGFEWRHLWQLGQGDPHLSLPDQEAGVQSLALSPNGALLAVGMRERLNIWNVRTQALVATLPKGAISAAFLPDGKTLITGSPATVRLWRTADWTEQLSLPESSGPIALSPDGRRLATISREGSRSDGVRVWDTATWKALRLLPAASGPMAFSPDGHTLATDSPAGITLWSVGDRRPERVLHDSTNVLIRTGFRFRSGPILTFTPDGQTVLAAQNILSERGVFVLKLWDAASGLEKGAMPDDPEHIEHTGAISSLAFSPDGTTLATASMDHSIRLWNFATRTTLATLQGHLNEVWSIAFSPDGQSLVSGAKDGSVKVWPTRPQQKEDTLPGAWEPLGFSKDSRRLAALSRDGGIAFFNLATREPEQQWSLEPTRFRAPSFVSLSDDLGTLAQGLEDGHVKLWNTDTRETTLLKVSENRVDMVALSPDGRALITGGRGQSLRWWDLRRGTNLIMEADAFRVLFSPDGRTLATFGRGSIVELWDATTRSARTKLTLDPPPGFASAFSPDGRVLAIAGQDDGVRLWEVATGQLVGTCTGHKQGVFSVAFSPDGRTLATASEDSTLKWWNVATQQELLSVRRLGGAMRGLMFSPDGRLLVGSSGFLPQSSTLRFYRAPLLSEIDAHRPPPAAPGERP